MAAHKAKSKAAKGSPAKRKAVSKAGRKSPRKTAAEPKSNSKKAAPSKRKLPDTVVNEVAVTTTPFQLPERFDSAAAASVLQSFKQHRGSALTVDGSAVRRVGAQGLQILLSATRTWRSDGHALAVENASVELIDAAQLLGLSNSDLSISGSLQ